VSLESRVEVLQDGRVGQRVRVRAATGASGILFAKVIGRGQLELAP
jgi:flagella basal body P-ring formation protein FlgA